MERIDNFVKSKVARLTAGVALTSAAFTAATPEEFNPFDNAVDSAAHLVLEKPPEAFKVLVDKLPDVQEVEADGPVLVEPPLPDNGWDLQVAAGGDGTVTFVNGPETSPLGIGSARLFTGTDGRKFVSLISTAYNTTDLVDITALSHSAYAATANGSRVNQPYMYLRVMTGGGQDVLMFDPNAQATGADLNSWQNWNTKVGSWQANLKGSPGTIAQYITHITNFYGPTITIQEIKFQVGPAAQTDIFDGNVDNFTIGVSGVNTTYNFEPTVDSDGDGLSDSTEATMGTDPNDPDTDNDFLNDGAEVTAGTNPLNPDTDGGGANDGLEVGLSTDPLNSADDAALLPLDSDGDGCTNGKEMGPNHLLGGQRNPLDFWDFYNVGVDGSVDLSDTLDILGYFGDAGTSPDANLRDRDILDPLEPWRASEANDGVDLTDALNNLASFGDSCD